MAGVPRVGMARRRAPHIEEGRFRRASGSNESIARLRRRGQQERQTRGIAVRIAIGKRLALERVLQSCTQAQVAEAAGISTKHLGDIEHGRVPASIDLIEAVADALGLDLLAALDLGGPITMAARRHLEGMRQDIAEYTRLMTCLLDEMTNCAKRMAKRAGAIKQGRKR